MLLISDLVFSFSGFIKKITKKLNPINSWYHGNTATDILVAHKALFFDLGAQEPRSILSNEISSALLLPHLCIRETN